MSTSFKRIESIIKPILDTTGDRRDFVKPLTNEQLLSVWQDLVDYDSQNGGGAVVSITYNNLLNATSDGTIKNGVVYCCSEVPNMRVNDRLFAIGVVSDIDPFYSFAQYISIWHDQEVFYSKVNGVMWQQGEYVDSWINTFHPHGVEIYFDSDSYSRGSIGDWLLFNSILVGGFGAEGRTVIDCVKLSDIKVDFGYLGSSGNVILKKGSTLSINDGSVTGGFTLRDLVVHENSSVYITQDGSGGGGLYNVDVYGSFTCDLADVITSNNVGSKAPSVWRKKTFTPSDWGGIGSQSHSFDVVTLSSKEILECAFISLRHALSPYTDATTIAKLTFSDLYGSNNASLTTDMGVGTGGWTVPSTAGIDSFITSSHPYIPNDVTIIKTLNLLIDNSGAGFGLNLITDGQITVYYRTSFIP